MTTEISMWAAEVSTVVTPRAIDLENEGLGKIIIPTATHGTSPGLFKFKEDFPWAL